MGGAEINSRLVAYCSDQAHSSVEKAGLVGLVKIRYIESDENLSLRGDKLTEAIAMDKSNGLIPFFVSSSSSEHKIYVDHILLCSCVRHWGQRERVHLTTWRNWDPSVNQRRCGFTLTPHMPAPLLFAPSTKPI